MVGNLEGRLGSLDGLVGSIKLVVGLAPTDVDVVDIGSAVKEQLGNIGNTGRLLDKNSIIDLIIIVDIRSLGDRGDGIDMGLTGGKNLDSALPDAIDLLQGTVGSMSGTRGNIVNSTNSEGTSAESKSTSSNGNSTDANSSGTNGGTSTANSTAEPRGLLGDSGFNNDTSLLLNNNLLDNLLLLSHSNRLDNLLQAGLNGDSLVNNSGNDCLLGLDLILNYNCLLLFLLDDNVILNSGGDDLMDNTLLGNSLLLAGNDGNSLSLLNDLLDFLSGLEGLVGLDLIGEALCK
jgi:hypothetical protein